MAKRNAGRDSRVTVVNSTEDSAGATAFARSAAKSNAAKFGVLRANDFKTLPKGFYVVFAGCYKTRERADARHRAAGRASTSGAFTQLVRR